MRAPGDILLISCYELGHQPYHLASLHALLEQVGYQPAAVDTAIDPLPEEDVRRARFVAIAVPMHTALRLGERVACRVRQLNPAAHLCCFGLYALLNADHLLKGPVDSVVGGEYEVPLLQLITMLETGQSAPVAGVSFREHASGPWVERTPFAVPTRTHLQPLTRYARLRVGGELRLAGYTETTRGCKHTCSHCPITPVYHGRFFAIPAEIVLADIRAQVAQGAQHMTFGDPDFWNGPTHAMRILRAMHQEFPQLTFDATIKIEHLLKHRHLLPEMQALGCLFIVSAVESLNDTVLERLHKGHTSADVSKAFGLLERVNIALRPSLLPFSPWETLESYVTLLEFFEQLHLIEHLDPVHLSIRLLIPPGSAVLDAPDRQLWIGELDEANYSYEWRHPDPRMDELQRHVAALVEQMDSCQGDPVDTFFQVKALVMALQGRDLPSRQASSGYGERKTLPRLTESWFCCAEPTRIQLARKGTRRT